MSYAFIKLRQLRGYVIHYGFQGFFLFFYYNLSTILRPRGHPLRIRLPSGHACSLRCGTTDLSTFHQVWIDDIYNLRRLRGWTAIERQHDRILAAGRRPLIIDGGSNIGLAALYFRHLFPRAVIVGVEPEPANHALAEANTAGLSGISIRRAGLWDSPGRLSVRSGPLAMASGFQTVAPVAGDDAWIDAVTADDICREHAETCEVFILKMDIEGAERRALYGARETQAAGAILIIEPHDWLEGVSGSLDGIAAFVTSWSFDFFMRGENVILVPVAPKPAA